MEDIIIPAANVFSSRYVFYARELEIARSEDPRNWKWINVPVSERDEWDTEFKEAVELLEVNWLDVRKKVRIDQLLDGLYDVKLVVKMKEEASGWNAPVTLQSKRLNSEEKPHTIKFDMRKLPKNEWVDVVIGTFKHTDIQKSHFEFSMSQLDLGIRKKGCIVKSLEVTRF